MTEKEKIGSDSVGNATTGTTKNRGLCFRCCMDVSASEFRNTVSGCNFCQGAIEALGALKSDNILPPSKTKKRYDVLIGLSGGVDSSMAFVHAVGMGYKVLAFSIDTGYNKPEADENILRLVEHFKVPFFRYTIDLNNFHAMQAAFMRSGVKNIEIPTDHILMAASYEVAAKNGIKTIISGGNVATESIMPPSWGYTARDLTHIKDIYRGSLKGLPTCGIWKWNYYRWIKRIKTYYILDYFDYDRADSEQYLIDTFGFKSTGEKHEENYFTWWFQNYYLFEKFGIDKRKAHYSSMIVSGQMRREEALEKLHTNPVYPRLGFEEKVMKYPRREHEEFAMDKWYPRIAKLVKLFQ